MEKVRLVMGDGFVQPMKNAALFMWKCPCAYIEIITVCIPSYHMRKDESISTKSIPNAFILVAVWHLQALRITKRPRVTEPPSAIYHLSTYSTDKHIHVCTDLKQREEQE